MIRKVLFVLFAGLLIVGVARLSFAMSCHADASQPQTAEAGPAVEAGIQEAVDVGNQICPVSGEKINPEMKAVYEHEGKTYNFCCGMCIEEFKKDPAKYIAIVDKELKEADTTTSASPAAHGEHQH